MKNVWNFTIDITGMGNNIKNVSFFYIDVEGLIQR